jgi:polyisoprenoid-binding protein YceI
VLPKSLPTVNSALRLSVLLAALWVTSVEVAAGQRPIPNGAVAEGQLSFDGRATAGDFTGTTATLSGELLGAADLAGVRGWVEAPVSTLKTGNNRRDRDLNKSMESDKYPVLRFELDSVAAAGVGTPDSLPATLKGRFILHGVSREAAVPSILSFLPGGVRVRASVPLNLKDYRIGGLSKVLGFLKMHEDIVVHVDVTFAYQSEAGTGPGAS